MERIPAELTVDSALKALKADPERVIRALESIERLTLSDDAVRVLGLLNAVIRDVYVNPTIGIPVIALQSTRANVWRCSEDEAYKLIEEFTQADK